MLPAALLSLRSIGAETFAPRYLTSRDEVWVRRACGEYADRVGLSSASLAQSWDEVVEPALVAQGAQKTAVRGVKCLLDRAHDTVVDAAVNPQELRKFAFEAAASGMPRDAILAAAEARLKVLPGAFEEALYADRASAKRVCTSRALPGAGDLVRSYNLALVQGILQRSQSLRFALHEHVRPVVRLAKLRGLIVSILDGDAGHLGISGPLSLFRRTSKYGHALATFFPTLVSIPRFTLVADCFFRERTVTVRVTHEDPLPRTHALPRECDSAVERALERDFRRLSTNWQLMRECDVVRAGKHMFFPDFTLNREGNRVLVEIVGFYTADYLQRKLRVLATAQTDLPFVVCIDESLDCGSVTMTTAHRVLRFRKRVDVRALLAAAEDACGRP